VIFYEKVKTYTSYGPPPSVSYGSSRRPSYGPPHHLVIKGNNNFDDLSEKDFVLGPYYRTRGGGWARQKFLTPMPGYKYSYSTIGYPNSSNYGKKHSKSELENGASEDYGRYNWENDGWTIAH